MKYLFVFVRLLLFYKLYKKIAHAWRHWLYDIILFERLTASIKKVVILFINVSKKKGNFKDSQIKKFLFKCQ